MLMDASIRRIVTLFEKHLNSLESLRCLDSTNGLSFTLDSFMSNPRLLALFKPSTAPSIVLVCSKHSKLDHHYSTHYGSDVSPKWANKVLVPFYQHDGRVDPIWSLEEPESRKKFKSRVARELRRYLEETEASIFSEEQEKKHGRAERRRAESRLQGKGSRRVRRDEAIS